MNNRQPRDWQTCPVCGKRYSINASEARKRKAKSKDGVICCSKPCADINRKNRTVKMNVSKIDDVRRWIAGLPSGTKVQAKVVAKNFDLASAAVAGRFIVASGRDMTKIDNGVYLIV